MVELELSEDLIRQIELTEGPLPDDVKGKGLEFDSKGNVHMMCTDQDGKLLRDVPVREINYQRSDKDELNEEYRIKHEEFIKANKKYDIILIVICLFLFVLVALTSVVIWRLKNVI